MAEWIYNEDVYQSTRTVSVDQYADGLWRWTRNRTGPEQRTVAQAISGGFEHAQWAYRNAVKENYPLAVPVPEGVEELTVVVLPEPPEVEPGDDTEEEEGNRSDDVQPTE